MTTDSQRRRSGQTTRLSRNPPRGGVKSASDPRKSNSEETVKVPKPTGMGRRRESRLDRAGIAFPREEQLDPAVILERFTERLDARLGGLDPGSGTSPSHITNALRQAVLEAFRTREDYVARLVELDQYASKEGMAVKDLSRQIGREIEAAGVRRITDPRETDCFVVFGGEGDHFEILRPAYRDEGTGRLILSGRLRRVATDPSGPSEPAAGGPVEGLGTGKESNCS